MWEWSKTNQKYWEVRNAALRCRLYKVWQAWTIWRLRISRKFSNNQSRFMPPWCSIMTSICSRGRFKMAEKHQKMSHRKNSCQSFAHQLFSRKQQPEQKNRKVTTSSWLLLQSHQLKGRRKITWIWPEIVQVSSICWSNLLYVRSENDNK